MGIMDIEQKWYTYRHGNFKTLKQPRYFTKTATRMNKRESITKRPFFVLKKKVVTVFLVNNSDNLVTMSVSDLLFDVCVILFTGGEEISIWCHFLCDCLVPCSSEGVFVIGPMFPQEGSLFGRALSIGGFLSRGSLFREVSVTETPCSSGGGHCSSSTHPPRMHSCYQMISLEKV